MCEISNPGRYAEHRTLKGKQIYFYQGTDFIRDVEEELRAAMREYFNCKEVELRPISGQMANEVVFKAMTRHINADTGTLEPNEACHEQRSHQGGAPELPADGWAL